MSDCENSLDCCSDVDDPFDYSMVNYPVYGNTEVTIFVPCPDGYICPGADAEENGVPGTYVTIPANTFRRRPTTNAGQTTIQDELDDEAEAAAPIVAAPILSPRIAAPFLNTEQSYTATCPAGSYGVPVTKTVGAGSVVGTSQAAADATALGIATGQATSALVCKAYTNTEQTATCDPGYTGTPVTVAAGTYFSDVSQADADNQALAAAEAALVCTPTCPQALIEVLTWAYTKEGGGATVGTGSGTGGSAQVTRPGGGGTMLLTSSNPVNSCGSNKTVFWTVRWTLNTRLWNLLNDGASIEIYRGGSLQYQKVFSMACPNVPPNSCPCVSDTGEMSGSFTWNNGANLGPLIIRFGSQENGGCADSTCELDVYAT